MDDKKILSKDSQTTIENYLEYIFIDGSHHKQYALVEIAKAYYGEEYMEKIGSDIDEDDIGSPA